MYSNLNKALEELKELAEVNSSDRYYYKQASIQLTKALLLYQQTSAFKVENSEVNYKYSENRVL